MPVVQVAIILSVLTKISIAENYIAENYIPQPKQKEQQEGLQKKMQSHVSITFCIFPS